MTDLVKRLRHGGLPVELLAADRLDALEAAARQVITDRDETAAEFSGRPTQIRNSTICALREAVAAGAKPLEAAAAQPSEREASDDIPQRDLVKRLRKSGFYLDQYAADYIEMLENERRSEIPSEHDKLEPWREREAELVKAARDVVWFSFEDCDSDVVVAIDALRVALRPYDTSATPDPLRHRDSVASAGRCTCTLVGNSFDSPLDHETDEHCPVHGRAPDAGREEAGK